MKSKSACSICPRWVVVEGCAALVPACHCEPNDGRKRLAGHHRNGVWQTSVPHHERDMLDLRSVFLRVGGVFRVRSGSLLLSPARLWGSTLAGFSLPCGRRRFCSLAPFHRARNLELDDEGISFTPLRGNPQDMSWPEVEAVLASYAGQPTMFRAGTTKLPLIVQWESRQRRQEINDFLRKKLGASFDVFDRPVPKRRSTGAVALSRCVIHGASVGWRVDPPNPVLVPI